MRAPKGTEIFNSALLLSGLNLDRLITPSGEDFSNFSANHVNENCEAEKIKKKSSLRKLLNLLSLEHIYTNAAQDWSAFVSPGNMQRRPDLWALRQSSIFFAHFKVICYKLGHAHLYECFCE